MKKLLIIFILIAILSYCYAAPLAKIIDVTAPSSYKKGESVGIGVTFKNIGDAGDIQVDIWTTPYIAHGRTTKTLTAGETKIASWTFVTKAWSTDIPLEEDITFRVTVKTAVIDDSRTITVAFDETPRPPCPYECCTGIGGAYEAKECPNNLKCLYPGSQMAECVECLVSSDCLEDFACQNRICVYVGPQVKCGNGIIDETEDCDGIHLDGETCVSLGYTSGILRCGSTCLFDTSHCYLESCGNGAIDAGENCANCPQDVVCASGEECIEGKCEPVTTNILLIGAVIVVIIFLFIISRISRRKK